MSAPMKIYDRSGRLIYTQLGAVSAATTTTLQNATKLASSATSLTNQVKGAKTQNEFGKTCISLAQVSGTLAAVALYVSSTGIGAVVGAVLGVVAGVIGLVGAIFGSDEDEAFLQQAAQFTADNSKIEQENYLLDQKKYALKSSIENAITLMQPYVNFPIAVESTGTGLGISAELQLNSAKNTNDYLKKLQTEKVKELTAIISSFEKVVDSIVNRNKYLTNMKNVQEYGSYATGAAALAALTIGILKMTKGDLKKGSIYAGSGIVFGAGAYFLFRQSQLNSETVATGTAALQQYSQVLTEANTAAKYPSKTQLIAALGNGSEEIGAINGNYNQTTGSWQRGDWKGQVVNSEPVQVKMQKGGSEVFYINTTYYVSRNSLQGFKGISPGLLR